MIRVLITALIAAPGLAAAQTLDIQPVAQGIWALVGPKEQRNPENLGNNATFGVVVTDDGVVLIDPGGSWQGAAMIDATIDTITDQPVTHVINTGGQDHRWLGNGYWQAQGATILASKAAIEDQQDRGSMQMSNLSQLIGDGLEGTMPSHADVTFETKHTLATGGVTFEIMHFGQAHTPGDSLVWLADHDVMFTGDIVYVDRILGVGGQSNVKSWIATFEAMEAFDPGHIVPGHGQATDLSTARRDSYDYLVNLRTRIGALIDAGGDIMDAPGIDQSAWSYLEQFESLAGRNAQTTYEQMEWE
ncbi:MBL fold metallo-hydrolase [Aquicoccus porphyridii]|nr:MBL fold metallo-hydrolase [Aquicoccus porphyridii]